MSDPEYGLRSDADDVDYDAFEQTAIKDAEIRHGGKQLPNPTHRFQTTRHATQGHSSSTGFAVLTAVKAPQTAADEENELAEDGSDGDESQDEDDSPGEEEEEGEWTDEDELAWQSVVDRYATAVGETTVKFPPLPPVGSRESVMQSQYRWLSFPQGRYGVGADAHQAEHVVMVKLIERLTAHVVYVEKSIAP
jgi:hypothetical protein